MQKEAEPSSALSAELEVVRISLKKANNQAIPELIKLLKSSSEHKTKCLIGAILGDAKDERVVRPLIRAVQQPENKNYSCNFLWPLEKYDCTKHLNFFVNTLLKYDEAGEAVWACVEIIRAMKGPFEPQVARRNIRKLLAEPKPSLEAETRAELAAFRLEAADYIMAKYFNYTLKTFWTDWNAARG
ncbi:MAG TPA: hypothetical protein VF690_17285 [Hymenobacter sp.]|jgi:hypothetical protein